MKIRSTYVLIMVTVGLLALSGCNLPTAGEDALQTRIAGTVAAENLAQAPVGTSDVQPPGPDIPIPTLTATLSPTVTLSPTLTLSPTITLTSTLEAPMVSVSTSTNCRTGPGTIFDIVGALMVGEQAEVVGKAEYGNYWIIKNPDGSGECWLWSNYATVTGPTDGLTVYTPPPTPTPAFVWAGTWLVVNNPPFGFTLTVVTDGRDFAANVDRGGVIITYTGTISDDYLSVSGAWMENPEETGPFKLYAIGTNQFNGNIVDRDMTQGFCGLRGGAGIPSPCYRP